MAVELETVEIAIVTHKLKFDQEVTEEEKRPLGLACHDVVEDFAWDKDDLGHSMLMQLLKDIKSALGVRARRNPGETVAAPKKKGKRKRRTAAEMKAAAEAAKAEAAKAEANGEATKEETAESPKPEAPVADTKQADTSAAGATEGFGGLSAEIDDPFAVPADSSI